MFTWLPPTSQRATRDACFCCGRRMTVSLLCALSAQHGTTVAKPVHVHAGRRCAVACSEPRAWASKACLPGPPPAPTCLGTLYARAAVRCCGLRLPYKPPCISVCEEQPDQVAASPWSLEERSPRVLEQRDGSIVGTHETWSDARGECAARGLHLCTLRELEQDRACCKTGCRFDKVAAWSGDTCPLTSCLESCANRTAGWEVGTRDTGEASSRLDIKRLQQVAEASINTDRASDTPTQSSALGGGCTPSPRVQHGAMWKTAAQRLRPVRPRQLSVAPPAPDPASATQPRPIGSWVLCILAGRPYRP